jgi:hypothetical protein
MSGEGSRPKFRRGIAMDKDAEEPKQIEERTKRNEAMARDLEAQIRVIQARRNLAQLRKGEKDK